MSEGAKKSLAAAIVFAWLLVSVPLGWGVYNTMKLFQAAPAKAAAPATPIK